ncbi:MAG: GNAT family N-acetyltransferase [Treponema sp.]|jgi:Leu/Phe-tRNA-protein transferase|nr:GNAT family N-acetyltransferase [Treponema sp.]
MTRETKQTGGYPLRFTESGMIFMDGRDNCDAVVDEMLRMNYSEEFCLSLDWNLDFVAELMYSGFLVMSETIDTGEERDGKPVFVDILLPKLHLTRSLLWFRELHIKKSVQNIVKRYELAYDKDYETIVEKCLFTHGDGWLTSTLLSSMAEMRRTPNLAVRPVSFAAYRNGELKAGEFGVRCGNVYTSYSGFREESNAGTAQMILMARYLNDHGFGFLDFGMPLDYKTDLGARNVYPEEFVALFRRWRQKPGAPFSPD